MPFDYQPILKGQLIELRPICAQDNDGLYAVAADPLIWQQHPNTDRHEEAVFQSLFKESLESGGALIAIDITSQRIIGSSRYHGYSEAKSEVEIGWTFLARSYWGGVYNAEMKRLMLTHAFKFVDRVVFLVGPQNVRSQRAVEKIGGIRIGTRADASGRESLVYQLTKAAYEVQQTKAFGT